VLPQFEALKLRCLPLKKDSKDTNFYRWHWSCLVMLLSNTRDMKTLTASATTFNPSLRFVRVVEERSDGMVAFEFAVGEPELFVEMVLPQAAFVDFCEQQGVVPTPAHVDGEAVRAGDWNWTLYAARDQRFKSE
jgi:phenol hydroxylase P0 protein